MKFPVTKLLFIWTGKVCRKDVLISHRKAFSSVGTDYFNLLRVGLGSTTFGLMRSFCWHCVYEASFMDSFQFAVSLTSSGWNLEAFKNYVLDTVHSTQSSDNFPMLFIGKPVSQLVSSLTTCATVFKYFCLSTFLLWETFRRIISTLLADTWLESRELCKNIFVHACPTHQSTVGWAHRRNCR